MCLKKVDNSTHEHSDQLNRYRDILETDYPDYEKIYVFLTPDGEEPSDVDNWDVFTYTDIVEIAEKIYQGKQLTPDVMLFMKNYIEVIRRDVVEDQQLIEICNKIYNKHKKALDLIYANRIDGRTQIKDAIISALTKLNKEGDIIYGQEWSNLVFRTQAMDELLQPLDERKGSWGTRSVYYYWFNLQENRFYIVFELGGFNVPENEMEIMDKVIEHLKPNDKKRTGFKYKRLFRTKWYEIKDTENMTEEVYSAVCNAVQEVKNMVLKHR